MLPSRIRFSYFGKRSIYCPRVTFCSNNPNHRKCLFLQKFITSLKYSYSSQHNSKGPMSENKITFQIEKANSSQQLRNILFQYSKSFNFIHRTVLLQKVTQRPFDQDEELVDEVINQIKLNWKRDYSEPTQQNSRAIANTICYMSRKKKMHHLDQEFISIDYFQLGKHLNPKQFVMTLNGILKLELIQKIQQVSNGSFTVENFVIQNVNDTFVPSLLVSMWFNILKFEQSSQKLNDFFANLLKNKHFKNNLIDYMQIVYCYVNSEGKRSIDLTYPVMTHPNEQKDRSYMGAHELSVLYEQLAKLKKIKEIYFSEQFNELLEKCYLRILNERDIPLRNVANVFNYLVQYQNPTSKTLDATFHKYYTVLKSEISLLQKSQPNRKPRTNVDQLSFVSLFNQLLQFYQKTENKYLNDIVDISISYIQRIVRNQTILNQYTERSFIRLLTGIDLAKKMIEENEPGRKFEINSVIKFAFEKQIVKRSFNEVHHLGKMLSFVYNNEIRSKQVCHKFKNLVESIPQKNVVYNSYQERLKQACILNKNCRNCINCFSK